MTLKESAWAAVHGILQWLSSGGKHWIREDVSIGKQTIHWDTVRTYLERNPLKSWSEATKNVVVSFLAWYDEEDEGFLRGTFHPDGEYLYFPSYSKQAVDALLEKYFRYSQDELGVSIQANTPINADSTLLKLRGTVVHTSRRISYPRHYDANTSEKDVTWDGLGLWPDYNAGHKGAAARVVYHSVTVHLGGLPSGDGDLTLNWEGAALPQFEIGQVCEITVDKAI